MGNLSRYEPSEWCQRTQMAQSRHIFVPSLFRDGTRCGLATATHRSFTYQAILKIPLRQSWFGGVYHHPPSDLLDRSPNVGPFVGWYYSGSPAKHDPERTVVSTNDEFIPRQILHVRRQFYSDLLERALHMTMYILVSNH